MRKLIVGVPDKILIDWLKGKEYLSCSDEGEAIGIAAGHYLATGEAGTVFMSADGFCNALNPITSLVIPENIKMKIVISFGRKEAQHVVMSELLEDIVRLIKKKNKKNAKNIVIELIKKKS